MGDEKDRAGTVEVSYETLLGNSSEFREAVVTAEDALEGAALIRRMRAAADDGKGISKSELARRLGVTVARISALEKGEGRQGPTYALLKRVARACGLEFQGNLVTATGREFESIAVQAMGHFEDIVRAGQEQAEKHFEQTVAATKEQVEKVSAQLLKSYEEYAAFRETVDSLVKSGTVAEKSTEDINKELVAFAQASFDKSVAASRALLSAKSINEVVELQNSYAKQSFDSLVAEATKLQELSVKVANEAFAPLNARVNAAVEAMSQSSKKAG